MPQAAKETTVPEGTKLRLSLQTSISSKLNEPGDPLQAILYDPLRVDGNMVLERGTEFEGRITEIKAAGLAQNQSSMTIVFDRLITPYGVEPVSLSLNAIEDYTNDEKYKANGEGKVKGGHSAKTTIDNANTGKGIGGPLGSIGGVLLTKGKEIRLQPGTLFRASFNRSIKLPIQSYIPKVPEDMEKKPDKPQTPYNQFCLEESLKALLKNNFRFAGAVQPGRTEKSSHEEH